MFYTVVASTKRGRADAFKLMEPVPKHHSSPSEPPVPAAAAHMFPPGPFPPDTGFFHHFWAWLEASLKMVRLRGLLILTEARQAGSHFGLIAGLFAGALVMALFGYVFLIITAVFAIALLIDDQYDWLMVMGGATLFHIGGAVVLILLAKSRAKTDLFAQTKEEFQKDHADHEHPTH